MSCETCHDPHRSMSRARASGIRGHAPRAPTCHEPHDMAQQGTVTRTASTCHMRATPVFDVGRRGDPRPLDPLDGSRIHPAAPGAIALLPNLAEGRLASVRLAGRRSARAHVDDPGLEMMALSFSGHAARAHTGKVDESPQPGRVRLADVSPRARYHRWRGAGRQLEARTAYEVALELDPRLAESMSNLGLLAREARCGAGRHRAPRRG